MKIALLHNEQAGSSVPVEEILKAVERCGHSVVSIVADEDRVEDLLLKPVDLVVAAGGDGTVAAAAEALRGRGVPLAILPFGTANNIASILPGRSTTELIERWAHASRIPFDRGVVQGQWGELPFWEGVGGGLLLEGMAKMKGEGDIDGQPTDFKIAQALQTYHDTLADLPVQRCCVELDDTQISGDLLLLEVLNTRSVGPNLAFPGHVSPSDGRLSVVVATTDHQNELARYFRHRGEGRGGVLNLPVHHTKHVVIHGVDFVHIDGDVRAAGASPITTWVEPGAIEVLV